MKNALNYDLLFLWKYVNILKVKNFTFTLIKYDRKIEYIIRHLKIYFILILNITNKIIIMGIFFFKFLFELLFCKWNIIFYTKIDIASSK